MDGKIIDVLKIFSKKEIKKFEEFLMSPFHNKNMRLKHLFDELIKFYDDYENNKLTREYLHKKVFRNTKFNDPAIRNLLSDLLKLAEEFIVHNEVAKNKPEKLKIINDVMIEKKAFEYMRKNMRIAEAELQKTDERTHFYYYYKSRYSYQDLKANIEQNKEWANLSGLYLATRNNLLNDFMYELMFLYCNYSQLQVKETLWEDMTFLEEILVHLEKNNYSFEPSLEIYYNLIKLQQTQSSEYYFRLKTLLDMHNKVISHPNKKIAYFILYGYISDKINRNDYSLIQELTHLTEVFIEQGYSNNESGHMSDTFFMNTVSINNILQQFDESEKFVHQNYKLLKPDIRTSTFNYCMGITKLHSGALQEALKYFSKTRYENVMMKLSVDTGMMIIYYDLDYIENCFSLIDSINIYIRSNPEIRKKYSGPFLNFNKLFKKLLRLKIKPDKYELSVLKEKISAEKVIVKQKWFLRKIEEIEQKA